jgi:hypothetical protein
MKSSEHNFLFRLVWHLILNVSFLIGICLYYGKMVVVLFLFCCVRHTENELFNDLAGKLLVEIFEKNNLRLYVHMNSC